MKYLLLLSHVAALQVSPDTVKDIEKPLCKNASEVGGGGKWKSVKETQVSRLPNLKERGYQKGCSYDKFMTYEPPTCKLPTHLYEVQKKGQSVSCSLATVSRTIMRSLFLGTTRERTG